MAHISYPDPETLSPEANALLARLPQIIARMFSGSGNLFTPLIDFAVEFMVRGKMSGKLRELVTCRMGHRYDAKYVLDQHQLMARAEGVTDDKADPGYSAGKAGLIGLTRFLAVKVATDGVTVNAIAPGRFPTNAIAGMDEATASRARAALPVQRPGRAEELAATVSFLASEDAGFITGATLDVNGGAFIG